ncbi:hypothetical protein QL104_19950 [Pseudomonas piscis]|uniref:Uncharacterized protein n=1 Tax=Pseudomonas piscis TaxID=2614538 RepID=A0ABY9NDM8_9PSED|nr:hypothetical protein [Pseudomonas piscis]WMN15632.1 hypothetical protein QL104_19950 [Pseudomonas piscis]
MPTETQLEQRVAALQSDLNVRDQALDDAATENNERELSRRDWFEEAQRLQAQLDSARTALKFYADSEHYHFESGNWDTVSGEPLNILWCGDEPDFIEDGTVARNALSASAEPKSCGACAGCEDGCRVDRESPSAERDERAEFEAWGKTIWWSPCFECNDEGEYSSPILNGARLAWQARAALDKATEGASHE